MKIRFSILSISLLTFFLLTSSFLLNKKPKHPYGKKFKPPKTYVYVPSGDLMMQNKMQLSVKGFFMSETEISNLEYNEFLQDLLKQGNQEDFKKANRKIENWKNEDMENTYHKHPAYADYPVLTIPKEGAEMYCRWLTQKLQDKYPKHNINFRLPTEHEWVYAARGGHDLAPYPWGGYYIRNAKGKFLANFKALGAGNIHYNRKENTYEVKTPKSNPKFVRPAPVKTYYPNDYGLYNMVGNAAEMVSTRAIHGGNRTKGGCYDSTGYDIKIESADEFEGWSEPSPFIGFRPIMDVSEIEK